MKRPIQQQQEHDLLVQSLVRKLISNYHGNVKADIEQREKPKVICRDDVELTPDVTATIQGGDFIFEVETADSISDEHTALEWKAFNDYCKEGNRTFVVAVPEGDSITMAQSRLNELGVEAEIVGL